MFLSTQLRHQTLFSARMSQRSVKQLGQHSTRNYSYRKVNNIRQQTPKVQFRKVIIQRGKNSRVRENGNAIIKGLNSHSRVTFRSAGQDKAISINESEAVNLKFERQKVESKRSSNPQNSITKLTQQSRKKKFSFIQKLGNVKVLKQTPPQQTTFSLETNQKLLLSSLNVPHQRTNSALSQKPKQAKLNFIKSDVNSHLLQQKTKKLNITNSRLLIRQETKSARPISSSSKKSSFSRLTNKEHREDIELITNDKKKSTETQRSFYTNSGLNKKKEKELQKRVFTWKELLEEFDSIENKINLLIEEKWKLIQSKLTDQKKHNQPNSNIHNKPNPKIGNTQTQSLSRFSKHHQTKSPIKHTQEQKFSFQFLLAQKKIDLQVMNQIKKLRSIDLSKVIYSQDEIMNIEEHQIIQQQLEKRKSQIIEKALAQSMVESELLKKYYSGQNYNNLSTSNYKVGQQNIKQKLMLKLKPTKSSLIKDIKLSHEQRAPYPTNSITKQSENQMKFNKHNQQDYEKFRYRHALFKPNLQPLPQSSYRSQFFSYGNIRAYDDPYKEELNVIFPITGGIRNSSYRSEYNQRNSPDRIDFRELDAYRDKYRQVNLMYLPQKRSQSDTKTLKKHKNQTKFINQLEYVKRLKTQSLIDESRRKEIASKINKQMFLSQSRKQFQNPEKPPVYYMKSEIKHKNLMTMKYDFKKKVHA